MFAKIDAGGKSRHRLFEFCSGDPEAWYQRIVLSEAYSYMSSFGLGRMDGKKRDGT
jgi:hypothetical protein